MRKLGSCFGALAAIILMAGAPTSTRAENTSDWATGHASRSRLIAGTLPGDPSPLIYAGLQMQLQPGWKTYWREPGDAGGIPPHFDFKGSANLAHAEVLFPVPKRMVDPTGTTFGYKSEVVFPIRLTPANPARPVTLKLAIDFGVCREICVPANADLALDIDPKALGAMPEPLARALSAVPEAATGAVAAGPSVTLVAARLDGTAPEITLAATAAVDVFVETAATGVYLPVPIAAGRAADGATLYRLPLADAGDVAKLKGAEIVVTLAAGTASREVRLRLPE